MSCWKLLGLDPTEDKVAIKKAFAKKIKENPPDADPETYQKLRRAYSEALKFSASQSVSKKQEIFHRRTDEIQPEAETSAEEKTEPSAQAEPELENNAYVSEAAEEPGKEKIKETEDNHESDGSGEAFESGHAAESPENTVSDDTVDFFDQFENLHKAEQNEDISYSEIAEIRNSMSYNKAFTLNDLLDYFPLHHPQKSESEKRRTEKEEMAEQNKNRFWVTVACVLFVTAIVLTILERL